MRTMSCSMTRMPLGCICGAEQRIGLLGHDDQDVGLRDIGIEHGLVRQDHLGAAGAAARFRAEALRHGGIAVAGRCSRLCR